MKKNLNRSGIIICIVILIASCNKESIPEKPYIKIPDEIWSYIKLTPGSWYIYKDSASGLIDSVNVTVSIANYKVPKYGSLLGNTYLDHYNDDYKLTLEKVDLSGNKTTWLDASSRNVIYNSGNQSYWELTDLIRSIWLMQYPSPVTGSTSVYKIASGTIEGNVYSDIQVVESGSGVIWWVKSIGIVKLIRTDGTVIKSSLLLRKK